MKRLLLVILLIFICSRLLNAQDVHFSQTHNTPALINPALIGNINGDTRLIVNYKDQWRSITVPYQTIAASYDMSLFKKNWKQDDFGIGISMYSDKAGDASMGTTKFDLSLSYTKDLTSRSSYMFGIQTSYAQRSMDLTKLTWDNQYNGMYFDPTLPSNEPFSFNNNFSYFDMGAGCSWLYTKNRFFKSTVGIAMFHITNPKLYFYETSHEKLYPKYIVHGSLNYQKKHTNMTYIPSLVYFKQGPQQEFLFGSMFRYRLREASRYTGYYDEKAISFGIYYRFGDAVIPCVSYELDGKYFIEVSYDTNVSKLTAVSHARGGFEISLKYISHRKNKRDLAKPKFR